MVGTLPPPVPKQEEGSPVKTLPSEAPKQARSLRERGQKTPPSADVCKGLSLAAAVALGCTGVPVRPEPFTCPEGAIATRNQLRWGESDRIRLLLDDRYDVEGDVWLRPGDTIVGVIPEAIDPSQAKVAPPGIRFLGGKVYVEPKKMESGRPGRVFVKYERVKLPRQEELPVCFIVEEEADELKDGAARLPNATHGRIVD
jgi:serine/threonine-protein kinase